MSTPDRVFEELRHLTTDIDTLDAMAAERFGVNRTDLHCIEVLTRVGPMRASELAAAVGLTSGGLSLALDRLEHAGYVQRRPHEHDRRSVIVEATQKARARDQEIFGPIVERMHRLLGAYQPSELSLIQRFLAQTRAAMAHDAGTTASAGVTGGTGS